MHGTVTIPTVGGSKMRDIPDSMSDRLIVALDMRSPAEAEALVNKLDGVVSFFKINVWLLFAQGTDTLIDDLIKKGKNIFLDYKMYDIPETVRGGVERARDRGIKFVTVHGYSDIIKAAVEAKKKSDFLKIFTITVLTSMEQADLEDMGYRGITVKELIELRVRNSIKHGSDGIIASAEDDPDDIRRIVANERLLIATPGIRMAGAYTDDHKRLATPSEAIRKGADYIIVGRPIIAASDPRAQALEVVRQMETGFENQPA